MEDKTFEQKMLRLEEIVAKLEKGDVIVRCNGVTLAEQDILVDTIRAAAPGDTIELSVWREGKMLDFTVVVGDMNHMVVY